jgi:hypothetical protein
MMRQHARQRFVNRRISTARPLPAAVPAQAILGRVLPGVAIDHAIGWLLLRPRTLQVAGVVLGALLVTLALYPLLGSAPVRSLTSPATPLAEPLTAQSFPRVDASEGELLAIVAAYNQASITAAVLGRPDPMAPYLAPDSQVWRDIQTEYRRRVARGEAHDPTLTRWGVLRIALHGDTATVETQEQWDDITSLGGQVVSSTRGILTRNSYILGRSATRAWQITDVTSTSIIQ